MLIDHLFTHFATVSILPFKQRCDCMIGLPIGDHDPKLEVADRKRAIPLRLSEMLADLMTAFLGD